jgi:hypothetical protein
MSINDRLTRTRSKRRALTAAGIATLVFSLVVSIGPAIAAPGGNGGNGGNAGTVKIHDATTGLEADGVGNDPWVCEFWIGFYTTDAAETGTWEIFGVAPTGDGVVESGTYDTSADGVDSTGTLALADGHYQLNWQAADDRNAKHKTFWVECEDTGSEVEASPSVDASPSQDESTPSDEEVVTPSDEEVVTPSDEEVVTPSDEEVVTPSDEEVVTPSDEEVVTPSDEDPEGEVKGGNPEPGNGRGGTESDIAPGTGGATELPDTAIPVSQSGVLATIGVLLIIAAHSGTRRERQLPSA